MTPPAHSQSPTIGWHASGCDDTVTALGSDSASGLSDSQVLQRRREFGPNALPTAPGRPAWKRLLAQFTNPLILVLIAAGAVTMLLRDYIDTAVILGVVVINAVVGFIQEGKAEDALAAVREMLTTRATVIRAGERHDIDAVDLVPGDVVLLEVGGRVPADLRLITARSLRVEEAALTGESAPVGKHTEPVAESAPLADRRSMAYSGTSVANGSGRGVVVATGESTEVGRIGALVRGTRSVATPLTQRLDRLALQITWLTLLVGAIVFIITYALERLSALDSFLAVVGLAVAAIPEGLPAVITIILAIASRAMARNRAIVRRLPAVETLGSVSVICSDKTGTLTRNEVTVVRLMTEDRDIVVTGVGYAPDGGFQTADHAPLRVSEDEVAMRLIESAALCNDAVLHGNGEWTVSGDPTEGSLATLAAKADLELSQLHSEYPRRDEIPFDSQQRFMATLHHDHHGRAFMLVKGAPERVWSMSSGAGDHWLIRAEEAAREGQRVLAVARAEVPSSTTDLRAEDLPPNLHMLGLVGMLDPPRAEAVEAIGDCHRAGISVKMITGDHLSTAEAVARSLDLRVGEGGIEGTDLNAMDDTEVLHALRDTDVIARANPENKIRLVQLLQAEDQFTAMTGDGANDAPALKAADIGVAMGGRGTDAARDAADLVLTDDNFRTIRDAVREGRVVYDNIKKSLIFILPTNGGEAFLILVALLAGITLPVTVTQILWVNMVTAVTLALALAFEPAEPAVMEQPPRPSREPLLTKPLVTRIAFVSLLMLLVTLAVFEWEMRSGGSLQTARTAAVTVLVTSEILYLFQARHFTDSALSPETFTGNRAALLVIAVLIVLQLAFIYFGPLQSLFATSALGVESWLVITGLAMAMFFVIEAEKALWRRFGVRRF
ncbi:MAG: HAD-IC family P-type ATPase [Candidatus Nanopelagicales bacterium]